MREIDWRDRLDGERDRDRGKGQGEGTGGGALVTMVVTEGHFVDVGGRLKTHTHAHTHTSLTYTHTHILSLSLFLSFSLSPSLSLVSHHGLCESRPGAEPRVSVGLHHTKVLHSFPVRTHGPLVHLIGGRERGKGGEKTDWRDRKDWKREKREKRERKERARREQGENIDSMRLAPEVRRRRRDGGKKKEKKEKKEKTNVKQCHVRLLTREPRPRFATVNSYVSRNGSTQMPVQQ